MHIVVIYNPVAGRRKTGRVQKFAALLTARGHDVAIAPTAGPGDACRLACEAAGADVLVAAGGDGTVNEVVTGLLRRALGCSLPPVLFLPLGTANVLAWELGLPDKLADLAALPGSGKTIAARPGRANRQPFVLMASVGLDARAVAAINTGLKRWLGGGAYLVAALTALHAPRPRYTATIDGQEFTAAGVIATRARRYAGPFVIAPDAGLDQPGTYVLLLQSYGLWASLRYGLALARGRLQHCADVTLRAGTVISISGPDQEAVQIDGDIATRLPVTISLDERVVEFLIPTPATT